MSEQPFAATTAVKVEAPAAKPAKPLSPFVRKVLTSAWNSYGDQIKGLAMGSIDSLQDRLPELWDQVERKLTEDEEFKEKTITKINEFLDEYGTKAIDSVFEQIGKTLTAK